ncbi:MAG: phytanoyl-CoA dioxygenase family protein [Actinomycetota bacterium]
MAFEISPPTDPTPPRPAFDVGSGELDEAAVEAFATDGVVCLRGVVDPAELPAIHAGCEAARRDPTPMAATIGGDDGPGFFFDFDVSDRIEAFRRLRDDGPMPDLARRLMRTDRLVRYFDNLFVKDGGGGAATPWHEDASFQRVNGTDSINVWLAFDDIPRETALQFLAGSHLRDEPIHLMGHFDDSGAYADVITRDRIPAPPPDELGARFESIWWDLRAGDALVWRHRTLHGAPANTLPTPRRAIAYIWLGDDAFYDAAPGRTDPDFRDDTIPDGAPLVSARFPQVRG